MTHLKLKTWKAFRGIRAYLLFYLNRIFEIFKNMQKGPWSSVDEQTNLRREGWLNSTPWMKGSIEFLKSIWESGKPNDLTASMLANTWHCEPANVMQHESHTGNMGGNGTSQKAPWGNNQRIKLNMRNLD